MLVVLGLGRRVINQTSPSGRGGSDSLLVEKGVYNLSPLAALKQLATLDASHKTSASRAAKLPHHSHEAEAWTLLSLETTPPSREMGWKPLR